MSKSHYSLRAAALLCWISLASTPDATSQPNLFLRGDANDSGITDLSDAVFTLGCLFLAEECPTCADAADPNDDGRVDISDPIYTLGWLFIGGLEPLLPGQSCGLDPTADSLSCAEFRSCPSQLRSSASKSGQAP